MVEKALHFCLIAGETSGDYLGAGLMRGLVAESPVSPRFSGIGGVQMEAEGLHSLFPMRELGLIGFAEILPHLPRLLKRLNETTQYIQREKPDAVVTIDSPGFCYRLAKRLREAGYSGKLIHYVAPSVWAYKPGRARKTAGLYDLLLALLPFEPPYFEREGLKTIFTGHPITELWHEKGDGVTFRLTHAIPPDAPLLLMLPGSRAGELMRHLPLYCKVAARLKPHVPDLHIAMPVPTEWVEEVQARTRDFPVPLRVTDAAEKKNAFAAGTAALAKSGTVTLELALAGVPMVVTYRTNPISAWLLKRMIRVRYVSLVNLIADAEILPERLQENATPDKLSAVLLPLLTDESARARQREAAAQALVRLSGNNSGSLPPAMHAARAVLSLVNAS